jgi:hypothetical protein
MIYYKFIAIILFIMEWYIILFKLQEVKILYLIIFMWFNFQLIKLFMRNNDNIQSRFRV